MKKKEMRRCLRRVAGACLLVTAGSAIGMGVTAGTAVAAPTYRVGDVVQGDRISVVVPKPGTAIVGIVETDARGESLKVATSASGAVTVYRSSGGTLGAAAPVLDECEDQRFSWLGDGYHWQDSPTFLFRGQSTPAELSPSQAEIGVVRALSNISSNANNCALADGVELDATYGGRTTKGASMFAGANKLLCDAARGDGSNVTAFGDRGGNLAAACITLDIGGSRIREVDILMDRSQKQWYVPGVTSCEGVRRSVEAVLTHEFGHAMGLGHVVDSAELTMSDNGIPSCQNSEASLGLGDVLGLESLY